MRLRLLVEIRAAALADIHTRERQETRWRQNIHTGAAVCPAFIRKHWEVCCMKIMDKAAFEEQNVFGLGAPNDAFARYFAGRSYLNPLTRPEDGLFLANVTFEPGCRNNWHIHHASEGGGQLLICTPARVGTRRRAKRRSAWSPAESSSSRRRSSTGTAPSGTAGSATSPSRCPVRPAPTSGASR